MQRRSQHLYEFGPYRLDTGERLLLRNGERVALPPKIFDTLVALLENRGRLVEKEILLKLVWPDSFVEEGNLTNNVSTLRKTLGEDGLGQTYIETVPKLGYRFTASVRELPLADMIVERHSLTRIETEEDISPGEPEAVSSTRLVLRSQQQLKWKVALGVAVVCLLIVSSLFVYRWWTARETRPAANLAQLKSIAILPFKTIGADGENEYLSIGMNEALIARLGNLRQLVVRPASAVSRYADRPADAIAAGREQGVDAVLDGSIQRAGDRIRVTVQLLRVSDRALLWSGQFDERFDDIFAMQDSISRQVAQGLIVRLSAEEQRRLQRRAPANNEAYQAYLRGRYFWNKRTPEGIRKSLDYFNQAIEIDPAYAMAYAGLADSYLLVGGYGLAPQKAAVPKAKAAATKAIEIDETLAEPHATLGLIAGNYDWDWAETEKQYRRAIELNPNYPTAHHWYGEFLAFMGRYDEGLAEIKRAQELDPLSLIISTDVGKVHYISRHYDRAIEQYKKTLEMDADFDPVRLWLGIAYMEKGQYGAAVAEIRKTRNLEENPTALAFLGYVYGRASRFDEARKVLESLTALSQQVYVSPSGIAMVNIGMGEKAEAFKWLDRMFEERAIGVGALKVDPCYDSLRSDPRFAGLLRRARFAV